MKQTLIYIFILSIFFVSCSKLENDLQNGGGTSLDIQAEVKTRALVADVDYFQPSDAIGMWIYDEENKIYNATTSNVKTTFTGSAWTLEHLVELTEKNGTLYAYSPYSESMTNNIMHIEVDSQTDYLYGKATSMVSLWNSGAKIELEHAMSQIVFKFASMAGTISNVNVNSVSLKNANGTSLYGTADIDITNGSMTNKQSFAGTIQCKLSDDKAKAFVIPTEMSATDEITVIFEIAGNKYERTLSNEKWESGYQYTYNVMLDMPANPDDLSENSILLYLEEATIEPWTNGTPNTTISGSVDAKEPDPAVPVDLGLPSGTKWANRNLGALNPSDIGNYYSWGECTIKDNYSSSTYLYNNQFIGRDISCSSTFDPVRRVLGDDWCMPNRDAWNELIQYCTWTWCSENNVNGYKVVGTNGNSIFIPAGGIKQNQVIKDKDVYGRYWTSNYAVDNKNKAYYMQMQSSSKGLSEGIASDRWNGLNIRPIYCQKGYNPVIDPNGHNYIDLGLSVLWSTENIGTTSSNAYGELYKWGEIEPYLLKVYDYKYDTTKYNNIDDITELLPEDDCAHVKWKGTWRMPTSEEFEELYNYCSWTWVVQNGVPGAQIVGPNGNRIFLPAAGNQLESQFKNKVGSYWATKFYDMDFRNSNGKFEVLHIGGELRYNAESIRPVMPKRKVIN